ncbi:Ankyrin repeat and SAM domain-containing protein 6 [Zancudomyces culisetae]|uniref:Ankyrin repeat and SAM domain-containing protein 6 n=1 Tax=Zancudomyces culisetae TaxID=1213189 RepID=A0A1R1PJD6_ZANCU|nr:Ankyrin repeat and SAM domain-containing protein 6 [Zancudomyces culisetae]|eukprot:OMH81057.1 Ankyrin repeat and SAM domain-containing protein 6 [Zancudomyces culisetae]
MQNNERSSLSRSTPTPGFSLKHIDKQYTPLLPPNSKEKYLAHATFRHIESDGSGNSQKVPDSANNINNNTSVPNASSLPNLATLFEYCARGDLEKLQGLIPHNDTALNACDDNGITLLMMASSNGYDKIISWLCKRDTVGARPLQAASFYGCPKCVEKILLGGDLNVNHKDCRGETALMLAAYKGYNAVVYQLLLRNAKTKKFDKVHTLVLYRTIIYLAGWSALMLAAYTGKIGVCHAILDYELKVGVKPGSHRQIVAELAAKAGYREISEIVNEYESRQSSTTHSIKGDNKRIERSIPSTKETPQDEKKQSLRDESNDIQGAVEPRRNENADIDISQRVENILADGLDTIKKASHIPMENSGLYKPSTERIEMPRVTSIFENKTNNLEGGANASRQISENVKNINRQHITGSSNKSEFKDQEHQDTSTRNFTTLARELNSNEENTPEMHKVDTSTFVEATRGLEPEVSSMQGAHNNPKVLSNTQESKKSMHKPNSIDVGGAHSQIYTDRCVSKENKLHQNSNVLNGGLEIQAVASNTVAKGFGKPNASFTTSQKPTSIASKGRNVQEETVENSFKRSHIQLGSAREHAGDPVVVPNSHNNFEHLKSLSQKMDKEQVGGNSEDISLLRARVKNIISKDFKIITPMDYSKKIKDIVKHEPEEKIDVQDKILSRLPSQDEKQATSGGVCPGETQNPNTSVVQAAPSDKFISLQKKASDIVQSNILDRDSDTPSAAIGLLQHLGGVENSCDKNGTANTESMGKNTHRDPSVEQVMKSYKPLPTPMPKSRVSIYNNSIQEPAVNNDELLDTEKKMQTATSIERYDIPTLG